jgi:hypothetical protein
MKNQIDKLILVSKTELHIIYTHKAPVCISGPDAYATYLWLSTPNTLRLVEFTRATVTSLEETDVNYKIAA